MESNVRALYSLGWGYREARVLHVASGIGIFTALSEKEMFLEELCQKCHIEPGMTEKLVIACIAVGLLERHGSRYKNTELASTYLVQGKRLYQGDIIAHFARAWDFWSTLENKVRTASVPKNKQID